MKKSLVVLFVGLLMVFSAPVRAEVDHWSPATPERLALCLQSSALYEPTILGKQDFNPRTEYEDVLKEDSCMQMDLPDRLGDGYVGVKAGSVIIRSIKTGLALRLKKCNNKLPTGIIVPRQKVVVEKGEPGIKGDPGKNCTAKDNGNGTKTITCADSSVTVSDGYTPIKGKDYFDGKNGYTPIKGKDYFDGTPAASVAVSWENEVLEDPAPPEEKGWWCSRHPVWCTIGVVAVTGIAIAALSGGGGGGGGDAAVGTPPGGTTDSGTAGGGGTSPGGTTGDGSAGGPSGPNSF